MLLKAKEDADEFINMLFTFETNLEYIPVIEELKKIENMDQFTLAVKKCKICKKVLVIFTKIYYD